MSITVVSLDEQGWNSLRSELERRQSNKTIVANLLQHLRDLGANGYILEDDYLDRDFTEAFAAYYSRLFKRHSKLCRRLHFFSAKLEHVQALDAPDEVALWLETLREYYLGFVVLRPIHQAPLARAVLVPPPTPDGYESHLLVKAPYTTHVLGAEFTVCGLPMTQQDSRIGACAQATIWSAARHFHTKHKCPWISTVDITEAAMNGEFASVSSMIPNGSESLSVNGMVAALRASGRHPLMYTVTSDTWRMADVINRYVDSGIPVIIALRDAAGGGHAVIASGQIFKKALPEGPFPDRPTRAEFCAGFYVNDDQRGPNLRMTLDKIDPANECTFGLVETAKHLIIPLPDKVYLPAEKAESVAWDLLEAHAVAWNGICQSHASELGTSVALGTAFVEQQLLGRVLARTYLTYGWKYKYRMLRNTCAAPVKRFAAETEFPKYVWVTEFGTVDSFGRQMEDREIFAHAVVDATAKNMGADSRLMFHAPGFVSKRSHDSNNPEGDYKQTYGVIKDDCAYKPKVRGQGG